MDKFDQMAARYIEWSLTGSHLPSRQKLAAEMREQATLSVQNSLNNAAANVKLLRLSEGFIHGVDLKSITDPSNIQL